MEWEKCLRMVWTRQKNSSGESGKIKSVSERCIRCGIKGRPPVTREGKWNGI